MVLSVLARPPFLPPPDWREVDAFIRTNDVAFDGLLPRRFAYPRVVSLCDFASRVAPLVPVGSSVGVVSGTTNEPEVKFLTAPKLSTLEFEHDSRFDLGLDWDAGYGTFDLVVCNQVLEHVFDPLKAMKNLFRITRPRGLVWVSIPTINKVHALPHFFSAGYYPTWLEQAFESAGLQPVYISFWGSRKYLSGFHWPNAKELRPGFHNWRDFVDWQRPLVDGRKFSGTDRWITDTWGLARRVDAGAMAPAGSGDER